MIRVKIVRPFKQYKVGDTLVLSNNEAFGLLDSGVAILTKDVTSGEYKTKGKRKR